MISEVFAAGSVQHPVVLLYIIADKCIVCKWWVEVIKRCRSQGTLIAQWLCCCSYVGFGEKAGACRYMKAADFLFSLFGVCPC